MNAILRGSRTSGYRTTTPVECPHCHRPVSLAGSVAQDRTGPHIALRSVESGGYTDADLERIYGGGKPDPTVTGVALPQAPGRARRRDAPALQFNGGKRA